MWSKNNVVSLLFPLTSFLRILRFTRYALELFRGGSGCLIYVNSMTALVWKLGNLIEDQNSKETSSWSLVHNVFLEIGFPINEIYMLSLHPSNSNVVFLLSEDELLQYDISHRKYEKLGEFPVEQLAPHVSAFHSPWPIPVPIHALPL